MLKSTPWLALLLILTVAAGCKKENIYTYGVDEVDVQQPGANKPNVKSDLEIISIAHTDLFGTPIQPALLENMSQSYQAMGAKRLVIDMIILNFLNDPAVQIPSEASMRINSEQFVAECYARFFVREPGDFEQWLISDIIEKDASITPELVWYAFLTSNEYRYY